ncbi:ThiJ/PfpI family protein [Xylariales sp. PMI_506]|nr:ThiJ/PfpI family protein [Xylariales sp. PMI_506]
MSGHTGKILFVVTSVDKVPGKDIDIGFWLQEFADPYFILSPKYDLVICSPKGGPVTPDPISVKMAVEDARDENATRFLYDEKTAYQETEQLKSFLGKADEFDAIYVVGGHGPMFDLAFDEGSQALIAEFYDKGKVVAADCAGVGSLTNVKLANGDHILKGHRVTGFSKAEVDALDFLDIVPFILEDKLTAESSGYSKASDNWGAHVVKDGRLVTGQNPASAAGVARAILEVLS